MLPITVSHQRYEWILDKLRNYSCADVIEWFERMKHIMEIEEKARAGSN